MALRLSFCAAVFCSAEGRARNERRNGRLSLCYNSCSSKSILAKFEMLHRSNPAHLLWESNYFFEAGNCVSPKFSKHVSSCNFDSDELSQEQKLKDLFVLVICKCTKTTRSRATTTLSSSTKKYSH